MLQESLHNESLEIKNIESINTLQGSMNFILNMNFDFRNKSRCIENLLGFCQQLAQRVMSSATN